MISASGTGTPGLGRLLASAPGPGAIAVAVAGGLGTEDKPVFPGMHEASALVAGDPGSGPRRLVRIGRARGEHLGGMHHAMAAHTRGSASTTTRRSRRLAAQAGAECVAYADIDAHDGDGVQAAFYADSRVLTISLHEHPATLFPFTGLPAEICGPGAEGSAVNIALPAGTGDASWLRAFHAIVPPLLRQFGPQILVSQHSCDTHRVDPGPTWS